MPFRLTVLPDTIRIDLGAYASEEKPDDRPFAGLTAVCKPLDTDLWADWQDTWPTEDRRRKAMVVLVRQQLVSIEGIAPEQGGPYDHATHFRALPIMLVSYVYAQLIARASITGEQEKNSDSPSGSDGTISGAA